MLDAPVSAWCLIAKVMPCLSECPLRVRSRPFPYLPNMSAFGVWPHNAGTDCFKLLRAHEMLSRTNHVDPVEGTIPWGSHHEGNLNGRDSDRPSSHGTLGQSPGVHLRRRSFANGCLKGRRRSEDKQGPLIGRSGQCHSSMKTIALLSKKDASPLSGKAPSVSYPSGLSGLSGM